MKKIGKPSKYSVAKIKNLFVNTIPIIAMSRDQSIQAKKSAQLLEGRGFGSMGSFGDLFCCSISCRLFARIYAGLVYIITVWAKGVDRISWDCSNRYSCNLFCLSD